MLLASYFLENFELIALSGFQRRLCYQVLQRLFIYRRMSSNSVAALRALLASLSVAAPAPLSAVDSGGTFFSVVEGWGAAASLLAHVRVRRFGGRSRIQLMTVAAVSLVCLMSFV